MSLEPVQVFPNKGQGHAEYMEMALKQATKAFESDEIPIGAVVVAVSYTHLTLPTKRIV